MQFIPRFQTQPAYCLATSFFFFKKKVCRFHLNHNNNQTFHKHHPSQS